MKLEKGMNRQQETSLYIALIHYPVLNKNKDIIGSAVTNLDIHDIARTARTYGVTRYYISTPYQDQHELVTELLDHWDTGHGAKYNPARKEALSIVRLAGSLEEIVADITALHGKRPLLITTSAQVQQKSLSYQEVTQIITRGEPVLLLFGTAHGLATSLMEESDISLPPIKGGTDYNHLSVRSAASIIIDRLLGC